MVPVPQYFESFPALESPTKSGFPAGGAAASPDVSQSQRQKRSSAEHWRRLSPRHSPRLSATNPDTCVAIIGVGFVGESLLREFSRIFPCIGYDIDPKRIAALKTTSDDFVQPTELTTDVNELDRATHFLITVPTLLQPDRSINLSYVHAAIATVLEHARAESTIVLESSVSVGTTRRILGPHSHLHHIGMSPERIDPGRTEPAAHTIPKLISGLNPAALKAVSGVYSRVFEKTVPVSSVECAEMTKLYENCFRMVNIAYTNEMSDYARRLGMDPIEMIEAADSKPYGFMKFSPGLGVGGHCIPVNPYYLLETAGQGELPVLEKATRKMWARPKKLARTFHRRALFADAEKGAKRRQVTRGGRAVPMKQPRILVVGVGFKPGQSVLSCSPGLSFAEQLRDMGCERLAFYDPLVNSKDVRWMEKLDKGLWRTDYIEREFDGVAVCTAQHGVDFEVLDGVAHKTFIRNYDWSR